MRSSHTAMVIREQQMQSFDASCAKAFENRMIERLNKYFAKVGEQVGEPQLRVIVRFAAAKAPTYALTHERSVALYLDLMCLLGSGFDTDPQIPWAAAILADRSFPTQAERIDLLHSRGWEYSEKISADFQSPSENKERSCLISGLSEIRQKSVEPLSPQAASQSAQEIAGRLRTLFPVKTEVIGDEAVRLLVRRAFESASGYEIRNARGLYLFSTLMFVLGAGFDSDPQFPWASKTLSDESLTDPVMRTNQLYTEARLALKRWWGVDAGAAA